MSHPVDPTFRLNAPFRTDFGRNEHDTQGAVKRGREGGDHTEYGHADRAAAQTGSFAKAGHRLHISTPAVAKQINTFEKEYGLTLFDRSRSGVQLTKAGKEFVEDAQMIVRQCEEILRRAQQRSTDGIATVRLGVSILRPGRRILDLWQRDAGKHTDIRLELVSMPDDSEAINDIVTHLGEDVDLIRPRHVQRLRRIRRPAHPRTGVGRHSPAARQRGRGLARTGRHALRTALPARCHPGDSRVHLPHRRIILPYRQPSFNDPGSVRIRTAVR